MISEPVKIGGLMRCCLQTLAEYLEARTEPSQEGDEVTCIWCSDKVVFRDGAWRWNRD